MALNQARKGCKGTLAVTVNYFIVCLLLIGSEYMLGIYSQINTMVECVFPLLPFPVTIYNPYGYTGATKECTHFMYFDGEHILIIIRQIRRTQPIIVRATTTLIDANVLVCIVLSVLILTPGKCGCVRGDRYFPFIDWPLNRLSRNNLIAAFIHEHDSFIIFLPFPKCLNPFVNSKQYLARYSHSAILHLMPMCMDSNCFVFKGVLI
jgi:hypothetical protein